MPRRMPKARSRAQKAPYTTSEVEAGNLAIQKSFGTGSLVPIQLIEQPHGGRTSGHEIQNALQDPRWMQFRCAVAFAKKSGVKHLAAPLHAFTRRMGTHARLSIGLSQHGTSLEGLQDLWRVVAGGYGDLYAFSEGTSGTSNFHPKLYLFKNQTHALAIVGSSNLTEGGLFTNHEACVVCELTASAPADAAYLAELENALDRWQTPSGACVEVDAARLQSLHTSGELPSEDLLRVARRQSRAAMEAAKGSPSAAGQFTGSGVPRPPPPHAFPSGLPARPVTPLPVPPLPIAPT